MNCSRKILKKLLNLSKQRHLYSGKKIQRKTNNKEMTTFKGNLSRNLKPKLTQNTPEKSEIARIFDKMRQKKDQINPTEHHNTSNKGINENEIFGMECNRSMKFENSPKLKPKNRTKFEEIRSFFEGQIVEGDAQKGACTKSGKIEVKKLNIIDDKKYSNIVSNIQEVDDGDITIKSTENIDNSATILSKKSSINPSLKSSIERPFPPGDVMRVNNVVRLPNPRKGMSPKSDKKGSLPTSKRKKGRVLKKKEELGSQPTLSEFLERKTKAKTKNQEGKSKEN